MGVLLQCRKCQKKRQKLLWRIFSNNVFFSGIPGPIGLIGFSGQPGPVGERGAQGSIGVPGFLGIFKSL